MSRIILVITLCVVIGVCAAAIIRFYMDYAHSLDISLNSVYYNTGSAAHK